MDFELKLHYFTTKTCSVCDSLLPKIEVLLSENFPSITLEIYQLEDQPDIANKYGVFTAPVLLLTIDNKESERWVRAFGLVEVKQKLDRIQSLIN